MRLYIAALMALLAVLLACGCTGTSNATVDPLAGSWNNVVIFNNTSITSTLVFGQDGNFNGYLAGLLSLSGHWKKVNSTAYNVYYGNKTRLFIMNGEGTQIWDAVSPQETFIKQ